MLRGGRKGVRAAALIAVAATTVFQTPGTQALTKTGDVQLASAVDVLTKGNAESEDPSLSADGRRVAFESDASNLHPADTDALTDVFVKDLDTGEIVLASAAVDGTKGNGISVNPSLSSDGTRVAFQSRATNLHAGDSDAITDVFVKDLVTGDVFLASTADDGTKGDTDSFFPSVSADGRRVAFVSLARNLVPDQIAPFGDIYVKDLDTGDIVLASSNDDGVQTNGFITLQVALSGNGRKAAFVTDGTNLDPADTTDDGDVYVKDLDTGDVVLATTAADGTKGNWGGDLPSLSHDGTKVAFRSISTNFLPGDNGLDSDIFVKDLAAGAIVRASTSAAGVKGNGESSGPALSADGTRVAFLSTSRNLDPADSVSDFDVYAKDLLTGDVVLASSDDGGAKSTGGTSGDIAFAAEGRVAAFATRATNLDPIDDDDVVDVYVKVVADCHPTGPFGDGTIAQALFGGEERERDGLVSNLEERLEPMLGPAAPVANEVGCVIAALEDTAGGL